VLKTRMQQGDGRLKSLSTKLVSSPISSNTGTIVHTARGIVASSGLNGLWRGTSATLVRYEA